MARHKQTDVRMSVYSVPMVSATEADWSREAPRRFWEPSRRLIRAMRKYQAAQQSRSLLRPLLSRWWVLQHRFWSVVTGADVPLNTQIGGGLLLPHPNGVVVHPGAVIGPNCLFFQQVTIAGACKLGGHVDIGAGAKIIGPLTIGDHVVIGANAVVTKDVPTGCVVAGIPAVRIGSTLGT